MKFWLDSYPFAKSFSVMIADFGQSGRTMQSWSSSANPVIVVSLLSELLVVVLIDWKRLLVGKA
jgi:hypothetical protein